VVTSGGNALGNGGGAGGVGGLGGGSGTAVAFGEGGGGAGWLGNGSNSPGAFDVHGGSGPPTFAGGAAVQGAAGGFGGGGGASFFGPFEAGGGGGGGGGYSGGGGGEYFGGGGGSFVDPTFRSVMEAADFNGSPDRSNPDNGYVIVGLKLFNFTGAIVTYTIPASSFYFIVAAGAQGGPGFDIGGFGAAVGGDIFLTQGTQLDIVVGGAGAGRSQDFSGGGGGGSFVWDPSPFSTQPAVPEPSTWVLTLLGFVALGYAGGRKANGRCSASSDA
jgi:hypothetical protein